MTNATWIFVLDSEPLGELKLNFAPEGWDEQRISILRSPKYKGLRRGVSTKLRFVGDGKDYIQQIYETNGTETEVRIQIYQGIAKPKDKFELYFSGIVDISTYNSDENIFVECDINESSFVTKLMSRDSVKIDLNTTESIDGVELDPTNEVTVQLHQREILAIGDFNLDETAATVQSTLVINDSIGWEGFTLPIALSAEANDIDNLATQFSSILFSQGSIFWNPAGQESIVTLSGTVSGILRNAFAQSASPTNVEFLFRVYTDDTLNVIAFDTPIAGSDFIIPTDGSDVPFTFDIDTNIGGAPPAVNLTATATISLICINPDASSTGYKGYEAEFIQTDFTVAQNLQWTDGTPAQGYLIFDAFKKITEAITDTKNTFKSSYFGPGGEGELQTIHSGKQIRQFPDTYVNESFETLFDSMDAQHNIGIGVEYDEFGNPYIRCEKEEYFYNGNVIFTVHEVSELSKDVARNKIYNEIEVGYTKAEYEEVNGLLEYNNKLEWADFIKTIKNKLSLVSNIRGDSYGIEFARRKQYANFPTEDTKYDNDNFTVIVLPDGANYQNARLENYDFAEGIFSPETAYNLDITPGRMLRAHGGKIRSGLRKYLDQPIRFQFAEQLSTLNSQRTGEGPIKENENIDTSALTSQRWIPDIYKYKSVFTSDQLKLLALNPNGIIKFTAASQETVTNYFYGWLNEIDNESDKDTAVWELLRVDTTSPEVTIIDPEGDSPDIPIPPVDPSVVQGTFEGTFPFVFMGPEAEPPEAKIIFDGTNYGLMGYHAEFEVQNFEIEWKGTIETLANSVLFSILRASTGVSTQSGFFEAITAVDDHFFRWQTSGSVSDADTHSEVPSTIIGTEIIITLKKYGTTLEWTIDGNLDSTTFNDTIYYDSTNADTVLGANWTGTSEQLLFIGEVVYWKMWGLNGSGDRITDLIEILAGNDTGSGVPNTATNAPSGSDLVWFNI